VAVASMMSTYRKVNIARAKCEPLDPNVQSSWLSVLEMGCQAATCWKNSKRESPSGVSGKYEMGVCRLFDFAQRQRKYQGPMRQCRLTARTGLRPERCR